MTLHSGSLISLKVKQTQSPSLGLLGFIYQDNKWNLVFVFRLSVRFVVLCVAFILKLFLKLVDHQGAPSGAVYHTVVRAVFCF